MQKSVNSFFRFVLGFGLFVSMSLGITYAVTRIELAQMKQEQVAAARQVFLGDLAPKSWWQTLFQ